MSRICERNLQVRPDDVLAANNAANAQAAAAIATASKPVVKFVPKSVSLFGKCAAEVAITPASC